MLGPSPKQMSVRREQREYCSQADPSNAPLGGPRMARRGH